MIAVFRPNTGLVVIGLVSLAFFIVTIIDMARRPATQWRQANSAKGLWVTLEIVTLVLFGLVSILIGILYFATIRPRLIAVERGGPQQPGWPGSASGPGGAYGAGYSSPGYGAPGSGGLPLPPPPQQPSAPPFGWYPDPSTRHELRYWDGTRWTEHVSDDGVQSTDSADSPPAPG